MKISTLFSIWYLKIGIILGILGGITYGVLLSANLQISAIAGLFVGSLIGVFLSIGTIRLNKLHGEFQDVSLIFLYIFFSYVILTILLVTTVTLILNIVSAIIGHPLQQLTLFSGWIGVLVGLFLFWYVQARYTAIYYESPSQRFIIGPANLLIVYSSKNLFTIFGVIILSFSIAILTFFMMNKINFLMGFGLFVLLFLISGGAGWFVFKTNALETSRKKESIYGNSSPNNPATMFTSKSKDQIVEIPVTQGNTSNLDKTGKIVVIGLDGLTWDVINPLLENNHLPNIAHLIKNGSSGCLQTLAPVITPTIWTSIATGKLPIKHGIIDFRVNTFKGMKNSVRQFPRYFGVKRVLTQMEQIMPFPIMKHNLITSELWLSRPIWDILDKCGRSVGVVGWYPTWPAQQINGFLITERAHCLNLEKRTYPDVLAEEIDPLIVLRHQAGRSSVETVRLSGSLTEKIDRFLELPGIDCNCLFQSELSHHRRIVERLKFEYLKDQTYINIAKYLYTEYDTNFFAVYLHGPDAVAHNFWKWREPQYYRNIDSDDIKLFGKIIDRYYIYMDEFISQLLQNTDEDTTIIIISDHGERPLYGGHWKHKSQTTHDLSTPGVIILFGNHIKKNQPLTDASVLDITPTILYLSGFPIAQDMDGKVLTQGIDESFLDNFPIKYIPSYEISGGGTGKPSSSPDDNEIEQRLKGLGYL